MSFRNYLVTKAGLLVRAFIRSPNYVAGSAGWTINKDGSVELNNGTFRGTVTAGTFEGTDFIINTAGAFFYSGAPAPGNLIASVASAAGTDGFGNAYLSGRVTYRNGSSGDREALQISGYSLIWYTAPTAAGPWTAGSELFFQQTYADLVGDLLMGGGVVFSAVSGPSISGAALWLDTVTGWFKLLSGSGGAGIINVDSWHSPGLANGWTGTLIASLKATNLVHVEATITVPATPNATVTTFTGIYVPVSTKRFIASMFPTGTHAVTPVAGQITTGGVLQLLSTLTAGDEVTFSLEYPLDV